MYNFTCPGYSVTLAVAGLCGLVIFVMCDIGDEMMMEVMVNVLLVGTIHLLFCLLKLPCFLDCYCAVVLFRSREHEHCGPQPGYVRAHIESQFYFSSLIYADA